MENDKIELEIGQEIKVTGGIITNGGLICEVIRTTKAQAILRVTDMFFPKHSKPSGAFQVSPEQQEYQKGNMLGKELRFWTKGSRIGERVGNYTWWSRSIITD